MTWNAHHRRGETLRTVLTLVDERRDGVLPLQAPGVAENFADELDLVGALLLKWHARLSGNLERALAAEPVDLAAAVVTAWRRTAEQLPGLRLVVDRCSQHGDPAMRHALTRAREREWARLALAAGLASAPGPDAVAIGGALEQRAREELADLARPERAAIPTPLTRRTPEEATMTTPQHKRESTSTETDVTAEPSHEEANASLVKRIKAVLAAA